MDLATTAKNQGFTYVKHSNVNLKKEQVMGDGSSRGNLFKQKERNWLRLKMIQAQVESVVPSDFSIHAQYSHLVKSTHPMAMMIRQSRERNT